MAIKHGANIFELSNSLGLKKEELLDFSSNINPFGACKSAKQKIIENIDDVSIYPDIDYVNLKKSISNYCKARLENILLGSGATELISSFISSVLPKNALIISPAYSEYERELKKVDCTINKYILDKSNDFAINCENLINYINKQKYDLVVICNPNNPTGKAFTKDEINTILSNCNCFFMIDETYVEFTDVNTYSSTSLTNKYDNLFVIRGTSKFFSTPGIRLGYAITKNDSVKSSIRLKLDLWNINIFASLMGESMFSDSDYIKSTYMKIQTEMDYLKSELSLIPNLKTFETHSNFILCQIQNNYTNSSMLYKSLLSKKIIIRDACSFEGLDDSFFRICTLNKESNSYLIKNLNDIFSK